MRGVARFGVCIQQRFKTFAGFRRRKDIGRGENRLAPQGPNSGFLQDGADALGTRGHSFAFGFLDLPPASDGIGIIKIGHRPMQAFAILWRKFVETLPVGRDPFQQCSGSAQALRESLLGNSHRGPATRFARFRIDSPALMAGGIPSAAGFEQEPGATLGLVNPNLD